ncbi:MAG: PAS domain S-box protein [Armatimonadetes bacterium]|nr:PAS domain S-box protein [Armatimonadota bacterium]
MDGQTPSVQWIDDLSPGDHLCWLYATEEERRTVLVAFIHSGLQRGEKVICVAQEDDASVIAGYLRDAGVPPDGAVASGQLVFVDPANFYLNEAAGGVERVLAAGQEIVRAALAEGYTGLRAIGDSEWLLRSERGAERLTAYEARVSAAIAGKRCAALCPYHRQRFSPELLLTVVRSHQAVVVGTTRHKLHYPVVPVDLLGPQRAKVELEQWLDSVAEHTRQVAALRESEERYRAIVEDGADPICRFRPDGVVTFVNDACCRCFGRRREELIGADFRNYLAGEECQTAQAHLDLLLQGTPTTAADYRVDRPDGQSIWLHWTEQAIRDAAGNVVEIQAVGRDITERKQLELELRRHRAHLEELVEARTTALREAYERLREEERRKDQFLATLAHELRNPLGAIASGVHLLRLRQESGRNLDPALDVLRRQVHTMARLLDDLLDVSRVARGKVALRLNTIRLDEVIRHGLETVLPLIQANRHSLVVTLPPEPLLVEGDATRLEQVVANLVNNAVKYTAPEGEIQVSLERQDGDAVLRVRDSGIGISPELLPLIFDLFVQGSAHSAATPGGLGIGLTLVRDLVELHGGTVEARSEGIGQGSEFIVRLPMLPAVAETPPPAPESQPPDTPALRILLVEDCTDQARMLAGLLRAGGHSVCVTRDGPGCLRMVKAFRPEVVVLDIRLPGMDGYEVARRIRAEAPDAAPVLIALTGYVPEENQHRADEAVFDHYLTKPVDLIRLQQVLAVARP